MNHDRNLVDLVLVIGTSLKVAPVSEVVGYLPANVPQIYISREVSALNIFLKTGEIYLIPLLTDSKPCAHVDFDIDLLGDCDTVVAELCRRAGWELKHEMIPRVQEVDVHLKEGYASRHSFTLL